MPGKEIAEIASSILWLKWGVALVASCAGVSTTATSILAAFIIKTMKDFKKDIREKIDSAFVIMGDDVEKIASSVQLLDNLSREAEKNMVRQQGEIDGIIAICAERTKCKTCPYQ